MNVPLIQFHMITPAGYGTEDDEHRYVFPYVHSGWVSFALRHDGGYFSFILILIFISKFIWTYFKWMFYAINVARLLALYTSLTHAIATTDTFQFRIHSMWNIVFVCVSVRCIVWYAMQTHLVLAISIGSWQFAWYLWHIQLDTHTHTHIHVHIRIYLHSLNI